MGRTKSADLDFSKFDNLGEFDGYVMIIDNAGKTICTNKIAGAADELINDVATTENGFAVVGWSKSKDADFAQNTVSKTASGFIAEYSFITE